MTTWKDLSANALDTMEGLGNFGPTSNVSSREVKGHVDGGKCYYDSHELRNLARGCIEVADWLDKRAESKQPPYSCKYCGQPTWRDPEDQVRPADYCHDDDHSEID